MDVSLAFEFLVRLSPFLPVFPCGYSPSMSLGEFDIIARYFAKR